MLVLLVVVVLLLVPAHRTWLLVLLADACCGQGAGGTWNKAQGFMLGGLRSAETGLERQACVTETGRRARSGRLAGLGLEIQRSRHQARILAVAAPVVEL